MGSLIIFVSITAQNYDMKLCNVAVEPPPALPGLGKTSEQKGIWGPGPADQLRFPEAVWVDDCWGALRVVQVKKQKNVFDCVAEALFPRYHYVNIADHMEELLTKTKAHIIHFNLLRGEIINLLI